MIVSAHAVTGAAGASALHALGVPAPVAVLSGFAFHAVLDVIPHYDYRHWASGAVDVAAAVLLLWILPLWTVFPLSAVWWLGGIVAALPDVEIFLKHVPIIPGRKVRYPSHTGLLPHPEIRFFPGMLTQIITTAAIFAAAVQIYRSVL